MSILLPMHEISSAYRETIERLFRLNKDEVQQASAGSLSSRAEAVAQFFRGNAISIHPLYSIVTEALFSIQEHTNAIDALAAKKTSLLHVRHVQELATVVEWISSQAEKYEEFNWRWKSYSTIHTVRNKILNLQEPIEHQMQSWIDSEMSNIDLYINKNINKKSALTSDCQSSHDAWAKYSNWLYPYNLKDIFKSVNRSQSYASGEYDWNSHAVHFSPLAKDFIGIDLEDFTYHQFSEMSVRVSLNIFLKTCWCVLKSPDQARCMFAKNTLLDAYKHSRSNPDWFSRMVKKGGAHKVITDFCLNKKGTLDDAIILIAGPEPVDPLAIIKR